MALGQHVAPVVKNSCVKFEWSSCDVIEVTANDEAFVEQTSP